MGYDFSYYEKNFSTKFQTLLDHFYIDSDNAVGSPRQRFIKDYDNRFGGDSGSSIESSVNDWCIGRKSKAPKDFQKLCNICNLLCCDLDYFFSDTANFSSSAKSASVLTGLSVDSIEMLQMLNDKSNKYSRLNQLCIDMINKILSSFRKEIKKSKSANGIYFHNIFFSMWEYIHADTCYVYDSGVKEDDDVRIKSKWIVLHNDEYQTDYDYGRSIDVKSATRYRTQKEIIDKLDSFANSSTMS
jgi:hypothetical protein